VPLDEAIHHVEEQVANVTSLDDALQRLEKLDERHGKIVELRFFVGVGF